MPISDQGKKGNRLRYTFLVEIIPTSSLSRPKIKPYLQNLNSGSSFSFRSMSRRAFRRNHPSGGGAISSGAVPTVAEAMEFEAMDTSAPFPPPQL